jgi:hypothetical protein
MNLNDDYPFGIFFQLGQNAASNRILIALNAGWKTAVELVTSYLVAVLSLAALLTPAFPKTQKSG